MDSPQGADHLHKEQGKSHTEHVLHGHHRGVSIPEMSHHVKRRLVPVARPSRGRFRLVRGVRLLTPVGPFCLHRGRRAATLAGVRNLRLTIAYDGTEYHGWQRQPGLRTVEGQLVAVLSPITQTRVAFAAAGRTDAGVHARGQVANFHTESCIDLDRLRRAANSRLESEIVVRRIDEVGECFNSRFHALAKHYRYVLWADSEKPPPNEAPFVHHWYRPLDAEPMAEAARCLVGTHDFKSFETTGSQPRPTTICTIQRLSVQRHGPLVLVDVEGDRFLYNMVRNIVGTLLEVGRGHWPPDNVPGILAACARAAAGPTAPPAGLSLMEVFYDERRAREGMAPSQGSQL